MDGLNTWLTIFLNHLNAGLALGVVLAVLLLLRPLLLRLLTPQQRVAVWYVAWSIGIFGNLWGLTSLVRVLPVTVWDLLGPRPGGIFGAPAFLPPAYDGPGEYPVVLPGGETAAVELNSGPLLALSLLWAAVAVGLLLWYCHRSFALMCWGRQGSELEEKELVALGADRLELWMQPGKIRAWITPGLPTSFVMGDSVYLQAELPKEQLSLVLRHELEHIRLGHLWFKGWANMGVFLYWWDPLIWLGYKYFCRDLELACDAAVLKELEPEERREYARTLVEMGAGRSLWSTPLCFGECDTAVRVKTAARPQRTGGAWRGLSWLTTVLLFLFFLGGPTQGGLAEDALLTWERGGGTVDTLVAHTMDQVRQDLGLGPILALQVWCVAEDGEHVWVVMELLEQGWVGAEYFWYPARDRLYFTHAEVLKKPPDLTGAVPLS